MLPTSRRKKRAGKSSPPTDPDPPSQSGHKRPKRGPDATSSTQRRPPAASKPLRPLAPHTSASQPSLSADPIQYATTSMSSLSMDAFVRPQGGLDPGYDEYGPIAGPIPSTWQDDRYGQYGSIPNDPHAQSVQQEQYSSGQYGQFGTNPYDPNAQHNPYQPQAVNPYQDPHFPQGMEIGTANPAPIGHQLDTGDPARSGYGTKHRRDHTSDKSKHVEPKREARGTGWSREEDQALGRIKRKYDGVKQGEEWERISWDMKKADSSRSADECQARWKEMKHQRDHPSDKSKHVEPERKARRTGWSSKEDQALGRIKKKFDRVGQGEEWERISREMKKADSSRSANECQARWNDLVNPVPSVPSSLWSDAEVAKLLELVTVPLNFEAISEKIPGRSAQACTNKYYDLLDEEEKARRG